VKRKHWWHASLRPSLRGLTTGVVHGPTPFELEIDLVSSELRGETIAGAQLSEPLQGQSAFALAERVAAFLREAGVPACPKAPAGKTDHHWDAGQARSMHGALHALSGALAEWRAGIPEETSPIQVWPHHLDLSMLWLSGEKIPDTDPSEEETSDKQMNFGFTFGDTSLPDPYLYVTAYPSPAALAEVALPHGTAWRTDVFIGAVLPYATLVAQPDPSAYLHDVWSRLLDAGREHLRERNP
jgi:hypothetical protein